MLTLILNVNNIYQTSLFLSEINSAIIMLTSSSLKKVHPKASNSLSNSVLNFVYSGLKMLCSINTSIQFLFLFPSFFSSLKDTVSSKKESFPIY